jgi:putative oxidoreductase
MLKSLRNYADLGLLVGRVGLGILFMLHGWPKLAGGQAGWERLGHAMAALGITFLPKFWGLAAGLTEFGGGILLILGFVFRPACLLIAFDMFVAFVSLFKSGRGFLEYSRPLEMLCVFVILLFVGPGKHSFDRE